MNNSIKPIRFNITPSSELPEQVRHYVRPRAHDSKEIARRRAVGRPAGTLMLEGQTQGLEMIGQGFRRCTTPEEFQAWASLAKLAAIGTALYLMNDATGQTAQRHTRLPKLGAETPDLRPSADQIRQKTIETFDSATLLSLNLLAIHKLGIAGSRRKKAELTTAKTMIHGAYLASCVDIAEYTSDPDARISNREAQMMVREQSLEAVKTTLSFAVETDFVPTAQQYVDPYSPAIVALHQTGEESAAAMHTELLSRY